MLDTGPCQALLTESSCLSEIDLLEALDDEADDATQAHLATCPACAQRAAHLRQLQANLRARLYRLFCPSTDVLMEFRQGWQTSDEHTRIAQHIATCPHCAAELELFERSAGGPPGMQRPDRIYTARPVGNLL